MPKNGHGNDGSIPSNFTIAGVVGRTGLLMRFVHFRCPKKCTSFRCASGFLLRIFPGALSHRPPETVFMVDRQRTGGLILYFPEGRRKK